MEPQETTQAGQSSQQPSNNFDPSVKGVAETIGKLESGGDYEAGDGTGDGAASSGAYQMTPAFLENWAPQAGIQYSPGMTLTPAQQDQVAENTIQTLGTKGLNGTPLTVPQIISYWNSGNPNAYTDPTYGQNNTYGSTANEVSKGVSIYNGLMSGSSAQSTPQTAGTQSSSPSWEDILLGGGAAALAGLWGYVQKPLTDAAMDAVTGAVVGEAADPAGGGIPGAITGAVGGIGQGIIQDITGGGSNSQSSQTTDTSGITDNSGQTQQISPPPTQNSEDQTLINNSINASKTVSGATNDALQGTQTNRAFAQTNDGKQGIATMAENGYVPEIGENGEMDYSGAMEQAKQNESKAAEVEGIAAGGSQIPIADVINNATQSLQNDERMTPGTRVEAQKLVGEYAREYADSNGFVSGEDSIKARHQQYATVSGANWMKHSTAQIEARKAVGKAFREASLKHSKNPELQEAAIKEQQKYINAKKVMKRLHQKKAPKQPGGIKTALFKTAARYAEIFIGDKIGGPVGAVLGYLAGEHINHALAKKLSKTKWDTKEMKSALDVLHKTKPDMYSKLQKGLEKVGVKIDGEEPEEPKEEPKDKMGEFDTLINRKTTKGLVDLPTSGAKKGEREIGKDEVMKAGKKIRFDMKTGKKYVSDLT